MSEYRTHIKSLADYLAQVELELDRRLVGYDERGKRIAGLDRMSAAAKAALVKDPNSVTAAKAILALDKAREVTRAVRNNASSAKMQMEDL